MKTVILALLLAALPLRAFTIVSGSSTWAANGLVGAGNKTVTGVLIYGGDGTNPQANWFSRVVLLDRGPTGFTYTQKLVNAAKMGALAVVVADNVAPSGPNGLEGQLVPAGTTNSMTAFLVTQADGAAIKALEGKVFNLVGPPFGGALPDQTGHVGDVLLADGRNGMWAKLLLLAPASASTVKAGGGVALVASIDVPPPVTFQWMKDGLMIQQANAQVLGLANVSPADSGSYSCSVTNAAGSAISGPYTLTVTP